MNNPIYNLLVMTAWKEVWEYSCLLVILYPEVSPRCPQEKWPNSVENRDFWLKKAYAESLDETKSNDPQMQYSKVFEPITMANSEEQSTCGFPDENINDLHILT